MAETAVPVRSWFVTPETTRLDLAGGWIEIKTRLSFGEAEALKAAHLQQRNMFDEGTREVTVDLANHDTQKILAYLVDWSARDEYGNRVTISPATIGALDPAIGAQILAAIDDHLEAQDMDPTALNGTKESP